MQGATSMLLPLKSRSDVKKCTLSVSSYIVKVLELLGTNDHHNEKICRAQNPGCYCHGQDQM